MRLLLAKQNYQDNFIIFAVLIQAVLVVFQKIQIDVFLIAEDTTTTYRVLLTAISMAVAITISVRRRPVLWLVTYFITLVVLSLQYIFFSTNNQYIITEGSRFLLPVVIPSALCIITVNNLDVVERIIYVISWIVFILALVYVIQFFRGQIIWTRYDMAFSYALLLPMVTFFSKYKTFDIIISLILFLFSLALGSRGASVTFVIFVIIDLIRHKKNGIIWITVIGIALISFIPIMISILENIGIQPRTLYFFQNGHLLSYDSGRSQITEITKISELTIDSKL